MNYINRFSEKFLGIVHVKNKGTYHSPLQINIFYKITLNN